MHLGRSVHQRERWQALQQHLKSARAALDAGERAEALKHTDAALTLDPAFLAVQTLRERILALGPTTAPAPSAFRRADTLSPVAATTAVAAAAPRTAPAALVPALPPPVPRRAASDALAQFEARARQRRLERRVAAAQQALAVKQLADARAAIDEITELDPQHPDLSSLLSALAAAEHERDTPVDERELPLTAAGESALPLIAAGELSDLPLVAPGMPDLPLGATAAAFESVATSAGEVLDAPLVAVAAIIPSVEPIPAAPDAGVGVIEPRLDAPRIATPANLSGDGEVSLGRREHADSAAAFTERRRSRLVPWLAAAAAVAAVAFALQRFQRPAPADVARGPAAVEIAVTAPAVVSTTGVDADVVNAAPRSPDAAPAADVATPVDAPPVETPRVEPDSASTSRAGAAPATAPAIDSAPSGNPIVAPAAVAPRELPQGPPPATADAVAAVLPPAAPPSTPPQLRPEPSPPLGIPADMPRELAVAPFPAPPPAAAARPTPSPAVNVPARPDDMQLVRDVLQRYRSAYQDLNAERARAIWPDVNEPALQRAFQGLESQTLTFDACDVQLRGSSATAMCRGTAEYVPKIGSRERHVEPRVWNFTLQKAGEAWQIQTARTGR